MTSTPSNHNLSELIVAPRSEIDRLFLNGETPTMQEMAGVVDGRIGPIVLLPDAMFLKKFINIGWVPWRGKVFEVVSPTEGKGLNRFRVGPWKFLRFHCETSIQPPLAGTSDVFCLNYDLPGNPGIIRRIRDDIRKVDEGLFIGTANMRFRGKHHFVAYFILRSTGQPA